MTGNRHTGLCGSFAARLHLDAIKQQTPQLTLPRTEASNGSLTDFKISSEVSVVDAGFEEPGKFMEVAAVFDESHHGDHRFGINQLVKRDVVEVQLAGHGNHHAVVLFFTQRTVGSDAQLTAQHDVECVRACTP